MPVQRALEFIKLQRENKLDCLKEIVALAQLSEIACSEGFQCSADEL